jgi:hypothetical protein
MPNRPALLSSSLALAALMAACSSVPRPPYAVEAGSGIARAYDPQDALRVAARMEMIAPSVAAILGVELHPPVQVYAIRRDLGASSGKTVFLAGGDGWVHEAILLGSNAKPYEVWTLAHEFVHWYAKGPWNTLPLILEEGLCNFVAERFDVYTARTFHGDVYSILERGGFDPRPLFRYTRAEHPDAGSLEMQRLYGLGYLLVARIGIGGLRELCEEATRAGLERVPASWAFERAGLDPDDYRSWLAAIEESYGPFEALAIGPTLDR